MYRHLQIVSVLLTKQNCMASNEAWLNGPVHIIQTDPHLQGGSGEDGHVLASHVLRVGATQGFRKIEQLLNAAVCLEVGHMLEREPKGTEAGTYLSNCAKVGTPETLSAILQIFRMRREW